MIFDAVSVILGAPSPSPIDVVVESQASTPGFTAWIPLVGALLALAGVVYASQKTGENMIKAEDRRARAAIDAERERARLAEAAEDKRARAAIAAEDHRAQAVIEGENLRHENELRRATRDHMLDTVRDTYIALEAGRRELHLMSILLEPDPDEEIESWIESYEWRKEGWESARTEFSSALDSVTLIGSDKVSALGQRVDTAAFELDMAIDVATGKMSLSSVDGTVKNIRKLSNEIEVMCRSLLAEMRAELHPKKSA